MPAETSAQMKPPSFRQMLERALLAPVRAMRPEYWPLLMVYFAYGALGLTAVADSFWVKKELTLSPAALAQLGVWLTLPWAMKMVFGELVDSVAILGSRRTAYVFIGASLIAMGLVILAGASSHIITFAAPETIYVAAQIMIVIGVVIQDVVADAMSTEVVPRIYPDGTPRAQADIDRDLGMVQILGRLALSIGAFAVAGLGGFLAGILPYYMVFLIGLVIPVISVSGALLVRLETSEKRDVDWRILGGGIAFGATVASLALAGVPFNQEIIFIISMVVIVTMLFRVTESIDAETRRRIAFAALIIFAFRATPSIGEGFRWFAIDKLGFDEAFFGTLAQIGSGVALAAAWFLSDFITRKPVATVLLWLTILGAVLSLPTLFLVFGGHEWSEPALGIGPRTVAVIDAAASSPLIQLSMVPLLTLVAVYAPPRHRATWFALMASFLNLALIAGQLATKYLNWMFVIERGSYENLPALAVVVVALSLAIPLAAIVAFGRKIR
jgi:MFS family permease